MLPAEWRVNGRDCVYTPDASVCELVIEPHIGELRVIVNGSLLRTCEWTGLAERTLELRGQIGAVSSPIESVNEDLRH
jgi:hypothetical protein